MELFYPVVVIVDILSKWRSDLSAIYLRVFKHGVKDKNDDLNMKKGAKA